MLAVCWQLLAPLAARTPFQVNAHLFSSTLRVLDWGISIIQAILQNNILISSVFLTPQGIIFYGRFLVGAGFWVVALPEPQRVYSPQTRSYFTLGLGLLTHEDIENLRTLSGFGTGWDSGLPQLILFYPTIGVNVWIHHLLYTPIISL